MMGSEGRRCKSKLRAGLPRNVKSMSKEVLEATLKKKRECEAKALKIVEQLLETDVTEEVFLDCLPFIHGSHFQDAVEERALSELCGYPLCSAQLQRSLTQRYRISAKLNKVYDITERKNFCSNECYKSARFVKDQLLTSPLWLRDRGEIPSFTLLPRFSSGGIAGEEVVFGEVASLKEEVGKLKFGDKTSTINTSKQVKGGQKVKLIEDEQEVDGGSQETATKMCLHEAASQGLQSDSDLPEEIGDKIEDIFDVSESVLTRGDDAHLQDSRDTLNQPRKQCAQTLEETKVEPRADETLQYTASTDNKEGKLKAQAPLPLNTVSRVEQCLKEWFTVESLCALLGEDVVREMVSNLGETLKNHHKASDTGAWDRSMQESYQNICRRLNLMELEDARYDNRITSEGHALKPLPDYSVVKEESVKMQLKVRAFYGGKTCYETIPQGEEEAENCETEERTSYLPLVDMHAKCALRRRIVLDRFNRVIPGLMQVFELSSQEVTAEVRAIVSTFELEAHNVTFKPPEWNLLGLVLLKMISLKNVKIKLALESEKAKNYTATILSVFRLHDRYLEELSAQLTDVNNILGRRTKLSGGD